MLCDIAIRQVCHTELVYTSAVNNLVPVIIESETGMAELAITPEEQDNIYKAAHRIIAHILKCFPMSNKVLLRVLRIGVPHITHDSHRFIGYIRNLIQCLEYAEQLRADIWDLIVDQMIVCDNMLTKMECRGKKFTADVTIFAMDEDERDAAEEGEESEHIAKLDGGLRDVLHYIAAKHNIEAEHGDLNWLHMSNGSTAEELFKIFLSLLETRMLLSVHVRYTSFLWLYICSMDETYATRLLDLLWSVIVRPHVSQADIAKAQGAAAYLAAFLARAEYLDIKAAMSWMFRIVQWCLQYIDNCGIGSKRVS
ncbi:unnamed protein product [Strongylus vulgaris]|uniref:Uncharacterized protein n=1 Tax=Strongylus vulgaris TaxID=40348 RepID=A0A3P7KQI7_STRVU|nr:unnamed protein product [Strongylus vulgaris]